MGMSAAMQETAAPDQLPQKFPPLWQQSRYDAVDEVACERLIVSSVWQINQRVIKLRYHRAQPANLSSNRQLLAH